MSNPVVYTLLALLLLTWGGNWVCKQIFWLSGLDAATSASKLASHRAGWIIGSLERLILAFGIVVQSWEVIAAVIALKSVARFQKLNRQVFAEYFLVGSLFSLLWAIAVTSAWLAADQYFSGQQRERMVSMLGPVPEPQPDLPPPCRSCPNSAGDGPVGIPEHSR
jgi:hypothetical protein